MADEKKVFTTERGTFRFLTLGREEVIKGKPTGKQGGGIIFKGEALEKMKQEVEDFISDSFPAKRAAGVNRPFKTDKDGNVFLPAKAFVRTKEGKAITIPVADKHGDLIKGDLPQIGNGSVGRFRVMLRPSEFGGKDYVNVRLLSIKLLKLVEGSATGFGDEDADYEDDDEFIAKDHSKSDEPSDDGFDDEIPF